MIDSITNAFNTFIDFFVEVYYLLFDISSFIISSLGFIWYAGKSLIVGIFKLFINVVEGDALVVIVRTFYGLSDYLGALPTLFLFALFFIVVIRILIALIFKILRLNLDYKIRGTGERNREPTDYVEDETYPRMDYK